MRLLEDIYHLSVSHCIMRHRVQRDYSCLMIHLLSMDDSGLIIDPHRNLAKAFRPYLVRGERGRQEHEVGRRGRLRRRGG